MLKSMLTHVRETRKREFEAEEAAEAGFTLIELMVVLLIIAILLAIAIPTFLGVTGSANDRASQSNLTNAPHRSEGPVPERPDLLARGIVSPGLIPLATVQTSAPEFTWTNGQPWARQQPQHRAG